MRAARSIGKACGALGLPALVAALFAHAQACNPPCTGPDRNFGAESGRKFSSGTDLVFETSPIDGPFIPFEGAAEYHIQHGLGFKPYQVDITLSFSQYPEIFGNGGSAPSAGNESLILSTDDQEVVIKNDTCADYWMRVEIRANPAETNDAATEGGVDAPTIDALETDAASDGG